MHILLGAEGCGVFRKDPEKIASNFREVLTEQQFFLPQIIFAVIDRDGKTCSAFDQLTKEE